MNKKQYTATNTVTQPVTTLIEARDVNLIVTHLQRQIQALQSELERTQRSMRRLESTVNQLSAKSR